MTDWLKLIKEKEDEILSVGKEAYKEAINNTHLRFIVEMNEDGEVYSWYDIAGGNSFHASTYNGKSIELFQFCFQFYEPEISEDDFKNKIIKNGYGSILETLEESAKENCTSVEIEIINGNNEELKKSFGRMPK